MGIHKSSYEHAKNDQGIITHNNMVVLVHKHDKEGNCIDEEERIGPQVDNRS